MDTGCQTRLLSTENNKNGLTGVCEAVFCAPSGARTLDPNIKSVVLYQLS